MADDDLVKHDARASAAVVLNLSVIYHSHLYDTILLL